MNSSRDPPNDQDPKGANVVRVADLAKIEKTKHPLEWGVAILLALTLGATSTAAYYTRQEVKVAEDQERRYLRAYAYVSIAQMSHFTAKQDGAIQVAIHTMGQTPAYQVKSWVVADILPYPLSPATDLDKQTDPAMESSVSVIATGSTNYMSAVIAGSPDHYARAADATAFRLYVFGRVDYTDIFLRQHWVTFCYDYPAAGVTDPANNPPTLCVRHNDADFDNQ